MLSSAFCKRPIFSVPDHPIGHTCGIGTSDFFSGTKKFLHSANLQATIQAAGFLRVLPKSSFKKLLLGTGLWKHAKMSTTLKTTDGLNNAECKKEQLSNRPPIPYMPKVDILMPKKEPQTLKVKLPDESHLNMPIYSHGNTKKYLAHIVAVLQIIDQKRLSKKCRMLAKAVVKRSEALKNLLEAAGSQDTISANVDVQARKVEIEQTQQMLQEAQKAHNKAIAETYKQLRNLLSSDAQSQWDCICREMHERDSWAGVNGQPKVGAHERGCPSETVLSYISSQSSVLMQPKGSNSIFSKQCASPRGPLCNSISCKWEC
jgi:hypothetical protein